MSETLQDITDEAIECLADWARENPGESPDREISELQDSCTPGYTGDRMQLAADNIFLALEIPDHLAGVQDLTPDRLVEGNIHAHIGHVLSDWWLENSWKYEDDGDPVIMVDGYEYQIVDGCNAVYVYNEHSTGYCAGADTTVQELVELAEDDPMTFLEVYPPPEID